MKRFSVVLLFFSTYLTQGQTNEHLIQYIHPLIGTQRMGHTFPGATVPFGAVQLSPETDTLSYELNGKYNPDVYKYCAGYQYDDKTIVGFSHTHFSGTGHSDLGDFLVMPTIGKLMLNSGEASKPGSGYRSHFSHKNEVSEANYYKVLLDDYGITAEMTTTTRVGIHQYTFPKTESAHIILDLMAGIYNYPDKNVWTYVHVLNDSTVEGYRQTNGWARNRTLYFFMKFSKPFVHHGFRNESKKEVYHGFWTKFNQEDNFPEIAGQQIKAYFDFKTKEGEKIVMKMAISPVSMDGAMRNMQAEAPGWSFDELKAKGQQQWEQELQKLTIETKSEDIKTNFYTCLYHAFINPTIYMDEDGQYKGLDGSIHTAKSFTNYTTFSLWDTHRALHPLFNLIEPQRNGDMIQSMLMHDDQSPEKMLPVWSSSGNENWCMSGYHAVSVIADAIVKGIGGFDVGKGLEACVHTAHKRDYQGIGAYIDHGFINDGQSGVSVSSTLEYSYDDWCIAQAAKKLGEETIYKEFIARSQNYKNVYNPGTGFMQPKLADGSFRKNFDPLSTNNQGFIEGNAWNYTLYAPHDPAGLIQLMGGNDRVVRYLDSLFTMNLPDKYFAETEDITRDGIIGNYVHGNEPSHHVAYLYDFTNKPWKTAERIRNILNIMYRPTPDGLSGNDDCGQMSAWYVFSALGFYPVAPGGNDYAVGSPAIDGATLTLGNGKTLNIVVKNNSRKNIYVRKVILNGTSLNRPFLNYNDLINGGNLTFYMSAKH